MQLTREDLKITAIASKDGTRPVLTAIRVSSQTEDGKHSIRLAATDGYQLTEKTIETEKKANFDTMLIPAARLKKVATLMSTKDTLEITADQFIISDSVGNILWQLAVGELIEGNYPDYQQLMPKESSNAITLNARYLSELMEQHATNTGVIKLQVSVSDGGRVNKLSPVRIDDTDERTKTVSVLMPLKS